MTLVYILAPIVLLGLSIFIHELGHLLGGKLVGIKAKTFSMGYGKGFLKKQIGDTTYQITFIPFGGYCSFYGEDPNEERKGEGYEYLSAAPWKRIVTVVMGPMFNLFFGVFLFFAMNLIGYEKETSRIYIPQAAHSINYTVPAYAAGLRSGDRIVKINDTEIKDFAGIQAEVFFSQGEPLRITYVRGSEEKTAKISPVDENKNGHYTIGVIPYGEEVLLPKVFPHSAAHKAGMKDMDKVLALDGKKVNTIEAFTDYISTRPGKVVMIQVERKGEILNLAVTPRLTDYYYLSDSKDKKGKEIIYTKRIVKEASAGTLRFEGEPVKNLKHFKELSSRYKDKKVVLEFGRKRKSGYITVKSRGLIGVSTMLNPEKKKVSFGFVGSLVQAVVEPYRFVVMNLKGFALMFKGKLSVRDNITGPIGIGKLAGDVFYYQGISAYILLMARISIILMVMNLLPIPVVDGGHLVFFTIEAIRGKPLNDRVMGGILSVGMVFLIAFGLFVIFNDIMRLPFIQNLMQ